jgi:hypothetical protein
MKYKLLYDDCIGTHPLKYSNQPVITPFHGYQTGNYIKKKCKKKRIRKGKKQQQQQQHQ